LEDVLPASLLRRLINCELFRHGDDGVPGLAILGD
jgi:hypothetical protein